MVKIQFQDNITKANASTFNTMQDNIEDGITDGVNEAKTYTDTLNTYTNLISGTDNTYGISYNANARGKTITITLSVNTLLTQISTGSLNYTLFTLPSGYRPSAELSKIVSSNYGHRFKLVIGTDGNVKIGYVYSVLNSSQYDQLAEIITFII